MEATQWHRHGDHPNVSKLPPMLGERTCVACGKDKSGHGWITTFEGGHIVCPSDWIITGVQDEHYPCKPSVFQATYELVEE